MTTTMGEPPPTLPSSGEIEYRMPSGSGSTVLLEVLARVPTDFLQCAACERMLSVAGVGTSVHSEIQLSYPQEMLAEAQRLATWLERLAMEYGEQLRIRVVDVQSVEGFWKSLRHGMRRYPAFLIDGRAGAVGWDLNRVEDLLEARVEQCFPAVSRSRRRE